MKELLSLHNIRKTYDGNRYVLDGIDFSIKCGEIALIRGRSGSGKSTLLNIIGILDGYSSGEYYFEGKMVEPFAAKKIRRERADDIGFVFQSYGLIESISVYDNIIMPLLYTNKPVSKSYMLEVQEYSRRLGISELLGKKASLLSGGEKQRVAICRAMIKKPKLIIADEPTGNLDRENASEVISLFKDAAEEGTAIIIVSHNTGLKISGETAYSLSEGKLSNEFYS